MLQVKELRAQVCSFPPPEARSWPCCSERHIEAPCGSCSWGRPAAEARTAQVGAVSAFAVNIEKLKSDRESYDVSRKSFSAQLTEKDAEIDAIKAEEEVVVAKLDKKNAAADSHGSDIPELIKEREELRPDVPKIYEQIKALRDEFKKEGDLWWETERAFRTQERAADQAKWEAQKDKRAAEYEENRKFRYDESTSQVGPLPQPQKYFIVRLSIYPPCNNNNRLQHDRVQYPARVPCRRATWIRTTRTSPSATS